MTKSQASVSYLIAISWVLLASVIVSDNGETWANISIRHEMIIKHRSAYSVESSSQKERMDQDYDGGYQVT